MAVHIRQADMGDLPALVAIDSVAPLDDRRARQIEKWIAGEFCHLIEVDNEVAGYCVLHYQFFDCGFIEMLMVCERFRKRGLGLRMIERLKSICTNPKLFTSTNQSNESMQSLLRKAHFVGSGHIQNLEQGDPELIFFWSSEWQ
ncbi:MAG: N-acetyltransferase family protein [Stenotrophomonas sp.]